MGGLRELRQVRHIHAVQQQARTVASVLIATPRAILISATAGYDDHLK